jgi:hypothetical protein
MRFASEVPTKKMASIVYIACTLTSGVCLVLLLRAYLRSRQRLLFWSTLAFAGLCLNNALLYVDVIWLPDVDLSLVRMIPALLGVAALCYGLIMEAN